MDPITLALLGSGAISALTTLVWYLKSDIPKSSRSRETLATKHHDVTPVEGRRFQVKVEPHAHLHRRSAITSVSSVNPLKISVKTSGKIHIVNFPTSKGTRKFTINNLPEWEIRDFFKAAKYSQTYFQKTNGNDT